MSFKENLREAIDFSGLEHKEVAYKANIPLRSLENYLRKNSSIPSAETAVRIAKILGVSVEYLVTGENTDTANDPNSSMFPGAKSQYKLSKEAQDIIRWVKSLNSEQCRAILKLLSLFR